jgi:hypothetical protein
MVIKVMEVVMKVGDHGNDNDDDMCHVLKLQL